MDFANISQLVQVILGGGVGYVIKAAWDFFAKSQTAKTPEAKQAAQLTHTNGQIDILARVNSELESDNDRLRTALHQSEDRSAKKQCEWSQERAKLLAELDAMRGAVAELQAEVSNLQRRLQDLTDTYK